MNSKHRKVLQTVLERPTRSDLAWKDIEALFAALGAQISEGSGSRVRVALNGVKYVYHRPHPGRLAKKWTVEAVRDHLSAAGVQP